jgi:GNAT superfamily N-acetyltransferase
MTTSQSSENVTIRCRDTADIIKCVELLKNVHVADAYPSNWPSDPSRWLTPRGLLSSWVAVADASIVGHVVAGAIDEKADPYFTRVSSRLASELVEIKRLFVAPYARGRGIGRLLLEEATEYARSCSLEPILEVTADRQGPVQFYERSGWQRVGTNEATWQRASGERPLLHQYQLRP